MDFRLPAYVLFISLGMLIGVFMNNVPVRSAFALSAMVMDTLPSNTPTGVLPDEPDTTEYIVARTQTPASFMTRNVAFVSEFIKRLNYQRTPDNQPMDSVNRQLYLREPYLRELFDQDDARLNPRSPSYSLAYKTTVDDFVTDVVRDTASVFLPDAHEQLFAQVEYTVRFRDTTLPATLYLKRFRNGRAYDWKILDSENRLPTGRRRQSVASRADSVPNLFIASETHETRFLNLLGHMRSRRNLLQLMPVGQPVSPALRALAEGVSDSTVTVERTASVHLFLNTHRNWVLQLDDFVRAKDNSGWLITNLYGGTSPAKLPHPIAQYLKQTN
ncbi:MAG: hypothetical protein EAZ91_25315 [Cytophagales bacterium]|nr:MAG: hypothetical protein EAZ91_25315 [Cytophagales bacterium]